MHAEFNFYHTGLTHAIMPVERFERGVPQWYEGTAVRRKMDCAVCRRVVHHDEQVDMVISGIVEPHSERLRSLLVRAFHDQ